MSDALELNLPRQYSTFSATAILLYDILLTFNRELDVIWSRRLSLTTVLYCITRYVQLIPYIPTAVSIFPTSLETCVRLNLLCMISYPISYVAWAAVSGLRVYALSERNRVFAIVVFLLNAVYIAPDLYLFTHTSSVVLPPPTNCTQTFAPQKVWEPLLWSTRACLLLGECIVLVLTLQKTYSAWRPSACGHASSLTKALFNYGVASFIIPLLMNVANSVLAVVTTEPAQTAGQSVISFRDAITSILVSRFLLELGELSMQAKQKFSFVDGALTTNFMRPASRNSYSSFPEYGHEYHEYSPPWFESTDKSRAMPLELRPVQL